jgi:hypothetical protein
MKGSEQSAEGKVSDRELSRERVVVENTFSRLKKFQKCLLVSSEITLTNLKDVFTKSNYSREVGVSAGPATSNALSLPCSCTSTQGLI